MALYVKKFSFRDYIDKVSDFYLAPDLLDKVLEFRNSMEVSALRLAINRATDEELEELHTICDQMDAAKADYIRKRNKSTLERFLNLDIEFHEKICLFSHNDLFIYALIWHGIFFISIWSHLFMTVLVPGLEMPRRKGQRMTNTAVYILP